jgi:hypothetical protein
MKSMLYKMVEAVASSESPSPEEKALQKRQLVDFNEKFFTFCKKELAKVNTFFAEKLAEATRKFYSLKGDLSQCSTTTSLHPSALEELMLSTGLHRGKKESTSARKLHDLKLAFSENYLSLVLLQNYQSLNYTGESLPKQSCTLSVLSCRFPEDLEEERQVAW